jgi:VanZ family protein
MTSYQFKINRYVIIIPGLIIALIDEGIQIISVDRGPSLIDALLFDFPGYLIGIFIIVMFYKKIFKI